MVTEKRILAQERSEYPLPFLVTVEALAQVATWSGKQETQYDSDTLSQKDNPYRITRNTHAGAVLLITCCKNIV